MRCSWLALVALAIAVSPAAADEPCRPIAGLEAQIRPGLVLLLGEIHGTTEIPRFVGDAACMVAGAGLPAVVALELPATGQARVEAFLDSDGGEAAWRTLLADPFWQRSYQDGRTSQAMLELVDRVRRLRGSDAPPPRIVLFDPGTAGGGQARDRAMARRLVELTARDRESVTLVLTGNLHSRTRPGRPGNADFLPMGFLLARDSPPGRVVALDAEHAGGTAWICAPECGVTELRGRGGQPPWEIVTGAEPPPGHDGRYRVGGITASPPARLPAGERARQLSEARRRAESRRARAAERPPSRPAPDRPLSTAERSLQGRWQGYDAARGFRNWSLDVRQRTFRAEGAGEWYEGQLIVHEDPEPPWVDFLIERCGCAYEGDTSQAVFGWDGGALLVAASAPGGPRPSGLGGGGQLIRFEPR